LKGNKYAKSALFLTDFYPPFDFDFDNASDVYFLASRFMEL